MSVAIRERPIWIDCCGSRMLGIVAEPVAATDRRNLGLMIAVGGPQYRVGSHRQFTLLARRLAERGYVTLRFDFRGMGDSDGEMRSFETVREDLRAAAAALESNLTERARIVIWAMCDAASAALMFCADLPRLASMVLVNPWARGESSYAEVTLKHYYRGRLASGAFWKKLLGGKVDVFRSLQGFFGNILTAASRNMPPAANEHSDFRVGMARGLRAVQGEVLLMLSGNDLTAQEFLSHAGSDPHWRGLLDSPRVKRESLAEADHTFSTAQWREWAEDRTLQWLQRLGA